MLHGLPLIGALLISAHACDSMPWASAAPDVADKAASCPDLASARAAARLDWQSEFSLETEPAASISGGVQAALELESFAAKLDVDLKVACSGLAAELGDKAKHASAADACKAATSAMADAKASIGAEASYELVIIPPHCAAEMSAMADCLGECDANIEPGSAKVECESGKLVGSCSAECTGSCELEAAAKCSGTCSGSCDAKFTGTCGGTCKGKCDGKKSKGECAGECKGTCEGTAEGECKGKCDGSCEMEAAAECSGTCRGECSVEMEAPSCEGEVKAPTASAECNARCDANVQAKVECTPAQVALQISGKVDAAAAAQYKAAIEKGMPAVLAIAVGMKDRAPKVAAIIKVVTQGAGSVVKSVSGKGTGGASAGARLSSCVGAKLQAAAAAAASVKASVDVSVDVQASASASGSGGRQGGGQSRG